MPIKQSKALTEKQLEQQLGKYTKSKSGHSIKLHTSLFTGLPDRLVLLPPGVVYFVELKGPKGVLSRAQQLVHMQLRLIGFKVYVIDSQKQLDRLMAEYDQMEEEILAWRAEEPERKRAARRAGAANRRRG